MTRNQTLQVRSCAGRWSHWKPKNNCLPTTFYLHKITPKNTRQFIAVCALKVHLIFFVVATVATTAAHCIFGQFKSKRLKNNIYRNDRYRKQIRNLLFTIRFLGYSQCQPMDGHNTSDIWLDHKVCLPHELQHTPNPNTHHHFYGGFVRIIIKTYKNQTKRMLLAQKSKNLFICWLKMQKGFYSLFDNWNWIDKGLLLKTAGRVHFAG